MARETTYSSKDDLLLGDIPLPGYLSPEKYVQDASNEIDSIIGFRYKTPLNLADPLPTGEENPIVVPARLLLQRVNNNIASGRLLMAVATPQENSAVHAYAVRLLREANDALRQIAAGTIELTGAELLPVPEDKVHIPLIHNEDPYSHTEAFYTQMNVKARPGFGGFGGFGGR